MSTTIDTKGREFEIAAQVADLLDTLTKDQQRQVMNLLGARYGLRISDPPPARSYGSRPGPKRRYS